MRTPHQVMWPPARWRDGEIMPPRPGTDIFCSCGTRLVRIGVMNVHTSYLSHVDRYYTTHVTAVGVPSTVCVHQTCTQAVSDFDLGLCSGHSHYARHEVLQERVRLHPDDPEPRRVYRVRQTRKG